MAKEGWMRRQAEVLPRIDYANGDFGVNEPGLDHANEPRRGAGKDGPSPDDQKGGPGCGWLVLLTLTVVVSAVMSGAF